MKPKTVRAVVVCTEHRGVFYGHVKTDKCPESITLTRARNCIYWSADVHGVLGLSVTGPTLSCHIGVAAPELTLWKITAVMECSDAAAKAWDAFP
jgi:hypothetical protein